MVAGHDIVVFTSLHPVASINLPWCMVNVVVTAGYLKTLDMPQDEMGLIGFLQESHLFF